MHIMIKNRRNCSNVFWTLCVSILVVMFWTYTTYKKSTVPERQIKVSPLLGGLPRKTLSTKLTCPRQVLSKHLLPMTVLASFPGSGNTWTRHLLHQMTGIATGAIYNDTFLHRRGFLGEGIKDGRVLAIKTHTFYRPGYDRGILLIRNPFETFIADFNRLHSEQYTGFVKLEAFINDWNRYFEMKCYDYKFFYMSWLAQRNLLLVLFDNLKNNLSRELHRILVFLQQSTNITGNVQCALNNSTGIAKRDHSRSLPFQFFYSTEKIRLLNQIITEVSTVFKKKYPEYILVMENWKLSENETMVLSFI